VADRDELAFEGRLSPAEVADTLTRLAAGMRAGAFTVSLGPHEVTVAPGGGLHLRIDVVEKRVKTRIEITLAWSPAPAGPGTLEDMAWLGGASTSTARPRRTRSRPS
jgi:amphi-Trp domain-containing protein